MTLARIQPSPMASKPISDKIDSNNLGYHGDRGCRASISVALHRFAATIGGREEFFSGGHADSLHHHQQTCGLARDGVSAPSASRGFRLPTYTDLYYSDPANLGNPLLKRSQPGDSKAAPNGIMAGTFRCHSLHSSGASAMASTT